MKPSPAQGRAGDCTAHLWGGRGARSRYDPHIIAGGHGRGQGWLEKCPQEVAWELGLGDGMGIEGL